MAQRQEHASPQGLSRGVFAGGGGMLGRGGGLRSLLGGGGQQQGGPDREARKAYGESARAAWGDFLHGPKPADGAQQQGRRKFLPHTPAEWKQFLGERKTAFDAFRNPKPAAKDAAPAAEAPAAAPQAIAAAEPAPMAPEPAPVLPEPMAAGPMAPEPMPEPLPPGPELVAPGVFEQAPLTPVVQAPESMIGDQVDEQELLRRYLAGGMGA